MYMRQTTQHLTIEMNREGVIPLLIFTCRILSFDSKRKKRQASQWIKACSGGVGHLNPLLEEEETSAAVVLVNSAQSS